MRLTKTNRSHLAELMGDQATDADAARFADYLVRNGYADTDDIPDDRWLPLMDAAFQEGTYRPDEDFITPSLQAGGR